ncbi:hypothetical protein PFISCL1PPCAC_19155, partial [Pristionchus fissidentatus]
YENIYGAVSGIYKQIWSDTLRNRKVEWHKRSVYGNYEVDSNGLYDGVLGELQNGTLDATADDFSLHKTRMRFFHYTLPISDAKEQFYEARQSLFSSSIVVVPFPANFTSILVTL